MNDDHVWRPLGSLLVAQGLVSEQELEDALAEQAVSGGRLGEVLIELGYATRASIMDALAQQASLLIDIEKGFGSGLREQIGRRSQRATLPPVDEPAEAGPELDDPDPSVDELPSDDLPETLREQAARVAAPPASARALRSAEPVSDSEFLAVVSRAHRYLEDRRASLPELPRVR
jgi:hypothetical protein